MTLSVSDIVYTQLSPKLSRTTSRNYPLLLLAPGSSLTEMGTLGKWELSDDGLTDSVLKQ
jgi:hypothetical protein